MPGRHVNNSGRGGRGQHPRRVAVDFVYKFHPQGDTSDKHYAVFETVQEKMLDSMKESIRRNARDTVESIEGGSKVDLANIGEKKLVILNRPCDFNHFYTCILSRCIEN